MNERKTKVLVADDHSVVRMGLAAIINLEADLEVCGEAENGEDAARRAAELKPDVAVVDLMMPGMGGSEATAAIIKASPETKVLILTTFGTSSELAEALAAGASAVKNALAGKVAKGTIAIVRRKAKKYAVSYEARPIAEAAKYTRSLPDAFIAKNGHDVTKAFLDYAKPLVGALPHCEIF